jgi:hypothetical protein
MALRSAVHKMPVLLLLLLFTSLLIHITRHLQWYVWKARTWRWENTEQNRMAKNDGEKGRIRKRAMITNYGVFSTLHLSHWLGKRTRRWKGKKPLQSIPPYNYRGTRFLSADLFANGWKSGGQLLPLEPERAGYWDQSVYTTQYG